MLLSTPGGFVYVIVIHVLADELNVERYAYMFSASLTKIIARSVDSD